MVFTNFYVPDPRIRLSGFLKSTYLESKLNRELPDAKNFPDKFRPESGFALNRSISDIFLSSSLMLIQNN